MIQLILIAMSLASLVLLGVVVGRKGGKMSYTLPNNEQLREAAAEMYVVLQKIADAFNYADYDPEDGLYAEVLAALAKAGEVQP